MCFCSDPSQPPVLTFFCFLTVSGEVPQEPVISTKTGHLYEKHIIEKHLRAEAKCPVTGVEMTEDDLMTMQSK